MSPSRPRPIYDGDNYAINESVGHQFMSLMQLMRRELEQRMAEHDLTDAQWKPLWLLQIGQAGTANELSRCMDMDPGAMTRLLDRLEAKALLERVRSDTDRRVVQLRLTPAGDEAARKVPHVLAAVNNDFLRGFSIAEWQQLRGLLDRMIVNGQQLQQPAGEVPA